MENITCLILKAKDFFWEDSAITLNEVIHRKPFFFFSGCHVTKRLCNILIKSFCCKGNVYLHWGKNDLIISMLFLIKWCHDYRLFAPFCSFRVHPAHMVLMLFELVCGLQPSSFPTILTLQVQLYLVSISSFMQGTPDQSVDSSESKPVSPNQASCIHSPKAPNLIKQRVKTIKGLAIWICFKT